MALRREIGMAIAIERTVTISVSTMTAKRPNFPEKGFHVEENTISVADCSLSTSNDPLMRMTNSKKNKKITEMVTESMMPLPNISYNFLEIRMYRSNKHRMKRIIKNANSRNC
jgi:hypothetical protein